MITNLPADVAIALKPMPPDFSPTIQDFPGYCRWSIVLDVAGRPLRVELGFSKAGGRADMAKETANLRASAWQAMELARLGRRDLLNYCDVDRNKRTVPPPPALVISKPGEQDHANGS